MSSDPAGQDALRTRLLDLVALTQRVPRGSIVLDKSFDEQGIDSLDALNILFVVEEGFGIKIDAQPGELRTLNDLMDKVRIAMLPLPADAEPAGRA